MRVIHIWVSTEMPDFIKSCLNSLASYSSQRGVEHILYTDSGDNIEGLNKYIQIRKVPSYIYDIVDEYDYAFIATRVDLIRYILLRDSDNDYTYYVDSDCYFVRDPFDRIFVHRDKDFFSYETRTRTYFNNTVLGSKKGSDFYKSLVLKSVDKLKEDSRSFTTIGPLFVTELSKNYEVDMITYVWMYKSPWQLVFNIYETEDYDEKIIKNTLSNSSYGIHFFKPPGSDNKLVNKSALRLINKINKLCKEDK